MRRFKTTNNIQNTSESIDSSLKHFSKQDAENSMIRYLIWAIPHGFIGTVRGIGALAKADGLSGDITGMTNSLGVAFNYICHIIISIILMFYTTAKVARWRGG